MKRPIKLNSQDFTTNYINLTEGDSLSESLLESQLQFEVLFESISEDDGNYKYKKDKWTIKQVLLHIIDVERLFVARALKISRDKNSKIIGFDEDLYAENDCSDKLSLEQLKQDFLLVRNSTISFFNTLDSTVLDNEVQSSVLLTPRIIGWLISGHSIHHFNVIKERYLEII